MYSHTLKYGNTAAQHANATCKSRVLARHRDERLADDLVLRVLVHDSASLLVHGDAEKRKILYIYICVACCTDTTRDLRAHHTSYIIASTTKPGRKAEAQVGLDGEPDGQTLKGRSGQWKHSTQHTARTHRGSSTTALAHRATRQEAMEEVGGIRYWILYREFGLYEKPSESARDGVSSTFRTEHALAARDGKRRADEAGLRKRTRNGGDRRAWQAAAPSIPRACRPLLGQIGPCAPNGTVLKQ